MPRTAESAEKLAVAGDVYALLATGEETDGAYTLIEARVPPGGGPPPHTQRDVEFFYVCAGEISFTVADETIVAGPGTYVRVDPGVVHAFRNRSASPATMLIQTVPSGLERYFRAVGRPVGSMHEHAPPTPEEITTLMARAPEFGIEIVA